MKSTPRIRIVIVDDHIIIRSALTGWLKKESDLDIVGEASSGAEAVTLCRDLNPTLVLMDRRLPDFDGIEATRRLLADHADVRVLVFSIDQTDEDIYAAATAGAWGYAPKSLDRPTLVSALRAIAAGEKYFRGEIGARLAQRSVRITLSTRELEVLQRVAEGRANKEIADELGLSLSTVKNHLAHILTKLDAPDRTRAVTVAMERGLLRP